jgi:hypothetical protein
VGDADVFPFFFGTVTEVGTDQLQAANQGVHRRSQFVGGAGEEAGFERDEIEGGLVGGGWGDVWR